MRKSVYFFSKYTFWNEDYSEIGVWIRVSLCKIMISNLETTLIKADLCLLHRAKKKKKLNVNLYMLCKNFVELNSGLNRYTEKLKPFKLLLYDGLRSVIFDNWAFLKAYYWAFQYFLCHIITLIDTRLKNTISFGGNMQKNSFFFD